MSSDASVEPLLTYRQVAEVLRCCVRHVRDAYVKTGKLVAIRVGRLVRFRREDVDDLIRRLAGSAS